ncbi:MAG: extracellular solute-binding protein [Clostridium sp.]|uniref:sugar ABC transporter substrate-binding protein n=1 Tax=Clostridium sp. TaxID=1506 RepID=UPI003D6D1CB2
MKRKVLSLLLALTCTVSLAACGTKKVAEKAPAAKEGVTTEAKPESGAKLVVWTAKGVETEYMKVIGTEFEKKYGVKVTYEEVGAVDAKGKMATDGPAGVGADVFDAPHDHTGELVSSGLILENSLFAERVKKDYLKSAVDAVSYEGKVYGYPTAIETYGLFYNKDVFPTAPKTYEEIIAKAKTFNNAKSNKFAFMWDVGNAYFSHSFIAGGGGYIFKNGTDKTDVGIDSPGAIEGAKSLMDLKKVLPINAADSSAIIMEGLFNEGKIGAMIDGPWAVSGCEKSKVKFGVAPLPKLTDGKQQSSLSGVKTLFVSAYSKYPIAAQMFASLATSDEMLLKRYELTKQIPPVTKLMENAKIKGNPMVAPFLEQIKYSVPMPSIPQMGLVWTPYGAAFSSMWNDGVAPEKALKTAAKTVRDAIAAQK